MTHCDQPDVTGPGRGISWPRLGWFLLVVSLSFPGTTVAQDYDPMRPSAPTPETADTDSRPPGDPELGNLPAAPGAEDTFYLCSACHSIRLVTQQRLTDARWDYLWDWMIREQKMPEQDAETKSTILNYLKTYYSAER